MKLLQVGLVVSFLALLASPAAAQTHPCDLPENPAAMATPTKGLSVSFCANANDEDGVPIAAFNFALLVDGAQVGTWTNATPDAIGLSPTTKKYQFSITLPVASRGVHQVSATASNEVGTSPAANPASWQVGGKPVKPANVAVKR